MFAYSRFKGDLNLWIPKNLENSKNIVLGSSCPLPYWGNLEDREIIESIIETYELNKKLNEGLSEKSISKRHKKI